MKIIHCADLHLDSKLQANLGKEKAKIRKDELLSSFVRLTEYASREGVSAILLVGDLFDTKNISKLSRNTVVSAIERNPDIAFYYLRGNHDSDGFLQSLEKFPDNLYLFDDAWTEYALGDSDKVRLFGLELTKENSGMLQNSFSPDPSNINIVMLHGQESETNSKDKAEMINIRCYQNKGINYLALGHIHAYKREKLDGTGVYCYCGCLEGRGFDETGKHGFVLLDIDEKNLTVTDTFVPFATRETFEIPVDITGLDNSADIIDKVSEALGESGAKDRDLVKVVLVGNVSVECEKDLEFIKHNFENNYFFFKIYDRCNFKVDYENFLLDESLKGEFVRLVMNEESMTEEEKGKVIRMGLSVIQGGKVL